MRIKVCGGSGFRFVPMGVAILAGVSAYAGGYALGEAIEGYRGYGAVTYVTTEVSCEYQPTLFDTCDVYVLNVDDRR